MCTFRHVKTGLFAQPFGFGKDDGEFVGVEDCMGDGVTVGIWVGADVAVGVGVWVGISVGVSVGRGVGLGLPEGVGIFSINNEL